MSTPRIIRRPKRSFLFIQKNVRSVSFELYLLTSGTSSRNSSNFFLISLSSSAILRARKPSSRERISAVRADEYSFRSNYCSLHVFYSSHLQEMRGVRSSSDELLVKRPNFWIYHYNLGCAKAAKLWFLKNKNEQAANSKTFLIRVTKIRETFLLPPILLRFPFQGRCLLMQMSSSS